VQYQIGDFSIISRLSIKTLRYYHECGLLEPTFIDHQSGYRYYDESSLERVKIINELKELEFSLRNIKEILDSCKDDSELITYAIKKSREVSEKIARYYRMQKKLEAFIQQTKQAEEVKINMNMEVIIKDIPAILIASIRFKGKYRDVTPIFKKLFRNYGRYCSGAPFSLYYDNDYKEDDADIEACVPVRALIETGDIKCRELKGSKALTIVHTGSYETLGNSYKVLIDHLNENKRKILLPHREVYIKGPGMILPRNPKKFVTEIQMLLEE
jgi:DNA-binding transcriptional MerR regulator